MTLGGKTPPPWRLGVLPPLGEVPPIALKRSGAEVVCCGEPREFIGFDGCANAGDAWFDPAPPSFGGNGLFRGSFSEVVEAEGVVAGDCAEDPD
jgi:hypothetical protein